MRPARAALLALVLLATLAAAGCSPLLEPPPGNGGGGGVCVAIPTARHAPGGLTLDAAALLRLTVTVDATRDAAPACVAAVSGEDVHLHLGDRIEMVANAAPSVTPDAPEILSVSTAPGPTTGFGGLTTGHVIATLTAVAPGTVSVRWVDCSGTGC